MRILTIEREYGSGASGIAEALARRLGWKLLDHQLTEEIARLAKVDLTTAELHDERCDKLFYRLSKVFLRGSYERSSPMAGAEIFDADHMVKLLNEVINHAAAEGNCVIVGRGAACILRGRPDCFHVFLFAPRDEKIRRIVATGISRKEAEELVDTVDKERAQFIKTYFNREWPNRALYHMMYNTALGDQTVIDSIHDAMAAAEERVPAPTAMA
jgi:cytidylate kinase